MNLRNWIEREGEEVAAEALGVTVRVVRSWRYGERMPRPENADRIVAQTHGEVSYAGCYGREPGQQGNCSPRAEAS